MELSKLSTRIVENYEKLKYELLKAQTFNPDHFGFPELYYKIMETDAQRVGAFAKAFGLNNFFRDKVVCEIGVGNMPLSSLYLPFVKKAYLIESNPEVKANIEQIIKNNGWENKVEFFSKSVFEVELPEKVDAVIGELMSIFCANELQVQIFDYARKFLKTEGSFFPNKILNFCRLCFNSFDNGIDHFPIQFTRHQPTFYSGQFLVNQIDFNQQNDLNVELILKTEACLSGEINGLFLESYVEVCPGANFTGTDSLMPPTIVRAQNSKTVLAGDKVEIALKFSYGTDLNQMKITFL
ncbi:hypothetical protein EGI22_16315 [Lacihabitans sp. LS3-19]|uniref:hypothetical protein n=1 Tax=Lacihabitans sp. LS3-19 TaxID=2487335 RepID=UPI0020CD53B6|nr:hypothetical protein [Lacihabitans sp. LS3-19]MCP9769469.1 hypothetical protein [Lacihabitans sp. LS3-19]